MNGSTDSLYKFIVPANLQNKIYKLNALNSYSYNLPSEKILLLRINNINYENTSIIGWGNNSGYYNIPADLDSVVEVQSTTDFSLALKTNGTLVSWGNNPDGEGDIPNNLNNVVQISVGTDHCYCLKIRWYFKGLG
ncbi:MAG: hypothetical protein ORN58_04325 [Sediminibacterium sp.]|nr:hypothetical protein [Sediminibacterium sp.]